ncbi:MAG: ComEC/Rec2 family competence protein, partial [Anaerolineaceae bacterium]|nr:ComEC/Rec2 family competence protein [Anaerolineaceae bacterium]
MPLLWLSLAFLSGILLADWLPLPWSIWLSAALISAAAAVLEARYTSGTAPRTAGAALRTTRQPLLAGWRRIAPRPMFLLLAAFLGGAARFQGSQPVWTLHSLAWYNNQGAARLAGVVVSDPDRRESGALVRVRVTQRTPLEGSPAGSTHPVSGTVLARLPVGDWQYGDRLLLEGKPVTPPEDEEFSYRDYLARQGIYTYLPYARARLLQRGQGNPFLAAIYHLRRRAHVTLNQIFPYPEAPLLAGILLGIERDIPPDVLRAFRDTGTSHIIAISGFNIAILAGLFAIVFNRLAPKMWAPLFSILAISAYTLLVGAQASVVRAAIMGSFGLLGQQIGRRQSGINTLTFTAALMALFNPGLPWDVSFQLSFTATLGLILFSQPLQTAFIRLSERWISIGAARRLAGPVGEYFLFTLAAQLTTLPVILYHFRRLSIVSLLANPLILPPQPLVMVLGGIAVIAGLVFLPLGRLVALLVWPLLAFTTRAVEWLSGWSGAAMALGEISLFGVGLFYAALLGFVAVKPRWQALRDWVKPSLILLSLILINVVVWRFVQTAPDGKLHLHLINLPGGPAALVRSSDGANLLINGSSSASQLSSALGRRLPPLGARLDALALTHNRGSALKGLPATLERFPPGLALWLPEPDRKGDAQRLEIQLHRMGVGVENLVRGQTLLIGGDLTIKVLATGSQGAALLLSWENLRILLPGGAPMTAIPPEALKQCYGVSLIVLAPEDLEDGADGAGWL